MANAAHVGIGANTENRLVFDAGALYKEYGGGGELLIGATRGGATFTVERDMREIEVDGAKGPIKGLRRVVRETARLEVELLEIALQTWLDLVRGSEVSDGTHNDITPALAIVSGDYITTLDLVADVSGSGDPMILTLENALYDGEWSFTTVDKDEGRLAVTFMAHYDPANVEVLPYGIKWPTGAS